MKSSSKSRKKSESHALSVGNLLKWITLVFGLLTLARPAEKRISLLGLYGTAAKAFENPIYQLSTFGPGWIIAQPKLGTVETDSGKTAGIVLKNEADIFYFPKFMPIGQAKILEEIVLQLKENGIMTTKKEMPDSEFDAIEKKILDLGFTQDFADMFLLNTDLAILRSEGK